MEAKDFQQTRWKEKQLLNKIWEIYPEVDLSWHEIFEYFNSGRFAYDVVHDMYGILDFSKTEEIEQLIFQKKP